jgi:hypothetical protein
MFPGMTDEELWLVAAEINEWKRTTKRLRQAPKLISTQREDVRHDNGRCERRERR